MSRKTPRAFILSDEIVAAHAGANVICLAESAMGRTHRLHAERPGPETNRRLRADGNDPYGGLLDAPPAEQTSAGPALTVVSIQGVLEQRAGFHDLCSGWTDGHDAIAERLCAALAEGDVVLVVDSPGGACAGLQEAVRSVLRAKAEHGRHVTAWADEQIGSAAAWWTLSVADEVYVPEAGAIGSIGARWAHGDISEALKKEGVKITHICWPNSGKVALAPDRPLSDEGRARAQRDINDAGEAFAAAVLAGPVARRTGLTRAAIVALSADMLTGRRAVAAGLADGVASLDDVMTYALALASGGEAEMATEYEKTTREKYTEEDPPPPADESEDEENDEDAEGDDTPSDAEGDEDEKEASDDAPPSSKREPEKDAAARAKAPRAMSQSASLAEILGARGDSVPALKAAAIGLRQLRDFGAKLTGQRSADGIVGGLSAMADDLRKLGSKYEELRGKHAKLGRQVAHRERMDLLHKLEAIGAYARGELFVDVVDDDGKRITTASGKAKVRPAKMWAEMKLDTLRGLADGKAANAKSKPVRRTPFEPDRDASARRPNEQPTHKDHELSNTFGHSADDIAKSRAALFG